MAMRAIAGLNRGQIFNTPALNNLNTNSTPDRMEYDDKWSVIYFEVN